MWRLRVSREVLVVVVLVEAVVLAVTIQQLASLESRCNDTLGHPLEEKTEQGKKEGQEASVWPPLYVVTPTYHRTTQLADLTRLAQTLMLVPGLHWVVVEDAQGKSEVVAELLKRTGLEYTHLAAPTPDEYKEKKLLGRGVFNRREGLHWVRQHAHDGVLYFADDDNAYDVRIFQQIRQTQRASVFPVGMILQLGVSSPVVRGGKVVGFHDAFQAGRKFAVDMAGFAVNLRVVHANPEATIPTRVSYLEDGFLRQLHLELDDLEPLAAGCTEVLVWHTKTVKPATPSLDHVSHADSNTNLIQLYHNLLR